MRCVMPIRPSFTCDCFSTRAKLACTCMTTDAASIQWKNTKDLVCKVFGRGQRAWAENSRLSAPKPTGPQFLLSCQSGPRLSHSKDEIHRTQDSRSYRR